MKYETAKRRKNTCITGFLMLMMWGWGGLRSHVDKIKADPQDGLLFLGLAFGLPSLILLVLAIYYSIVAKNWNMTSLMNLMNLKKVPNNRKKINNLKSTF